MAGQQMSELPERLAERLADRMERRRFIRRSSQIIFGTVAGLAAGGGAQVLTARKAFANECGARSGNGPGCPTFNGFTPCGPSPCCTWYNSHDNRNCNCQSTPGHCKGAGANNNFCNGDGFFYSGTNCWSCSYNIGGCDVVVSCCDCGIKSAKASTCGAGLGYYANRCVTWQQTVIHC
jgi:hypothetical protein